MCAMLVLFYASVTVEGVAFDANCTIDSNCTDTNNECSTKCVCTSASFRNDTSNTCDFRTAPGVACSITDECVTNAMCNTTCTCNTGYTATPTTTPTSCQSSDAAIIIAHMYVFIFGIVASLYFLV